MKKSYQRFLYTTPGALIRKSVLYQTGIFQIVTRDCVQKSPVPSEREGWIIEKVSLGDKQDVMVLGWGKRVMHLDSMLL